MNEHFINKISRKKICINKRIKLKKSFDKIVKM